VRIEKSTLVVPSRGEKPWCNVADMLCVASEGRYLGIFKHLGSGENLG